MPLLCVLRLRCVRSLCGGHGGYLGLCYVRLRLPSRSPGVRVCRLLPLRSSPSLRLHVRATVRTGGRSLVWRGASGGN